jgi:hypothetical protein
MTREAAIPMGSHVPSIGDPKWAGSASSRTSSGSSGADRLGRPRDETGSTLMTRRIDGSLRGGDLDQ